MMQIWEHIRTALGAFRRSLREARRLIARGPSHSDRRMIARMQRESIQRELANRHVLGNRQPEANRSAVRVYEERQEQAYWKLWRLIRPAGTGPIPPQNFDPSVHEHITLALSVVADFDAAREEPGAFAECLYRPASSLPYSPAVIRRCCEFLIDVADNPMPSGEGDHDLLKKERDALGVALFSLDYFLDVPASEIPRQPVENLEYAKRMNPGPPGQPVTPVPGDAVTRLGSVVPDRVDQVIGVSDDDEWIVLTTSGASVQIMRDAKSGRWNEVNAIIPAAASWLDPTPPSGMASLDKV